MSSKNKMGRDPFKKSVEAQPQQSRLFQEVVKPPSSIEKVKEMQIKVNWGEFYSQITKDLRKLFVFALLFAPYMISCAPRAYVTTQNEADLKRQVIEMQKVVGRQASQIEELSSKVLLLSDKIENKDKSTTQLINPQTNASSNSGDLKIYDLVVKDLKKNDLISMGKNTDLLRKGYKNSPLADSAEFLFGQALYQTHSFKKSAAVFEKLYGESPDGPRAVSSLYFLGLSYLKLHRDSEAKEALQSVMTIYPGSFEAVEASKVLVTMKKGNS